ncbi:uncharacterized protein B0H18DRAFT_1118236 [Fomitopsis serialis]|uniref:uncharacterized protein n=1 Tax=Fomitopsis serialis TaxID=139415 RepID=UPI0020081C8E|nr:uncharacterized protein B0H18DRAFT_1118236 [Neoantrodia serialis]KAH9927710.1 hypothetical protein B0H18DRAFT_1118236 [Neoantrodia serialis]
MTIVDTTGIHFLPVRWCGCAGAASHTSQLLDCGLYPASQRAARTCFTFTVLDDFLLDNLECKTTAMNYYRRLRRVTDPVFPHEVPDRYLELLRVSREWTLLQAKKEHGYGRPGVGFRETADDRDYLYARTYVMDGNFHAEQMRMRNPGNDVPLMPGKMFMVNPGPYEDHLLVAKEVKMPSTCHDHKAVSQANADRHKLAVTGIGATSCARHGCFVPHSVVNFQKGERQMNMDYSLSNALGYQSKGLTHVYLCYDIVCQYHVYLDKRFAGNPHLHMPSGLVLYKCIGLFHVHGHQAVCEVRHSLTFTKGAGEVDGEIIETQWSTTNRISGSTRTMSTSHRQETLDRHMNDWNWKKMITMVASLRRKIKANRPLLAEMKQDLLAKESGLNAETLQSWKRELNIAQRRRLTNVKAMDKYLVKKPILPTQTDLLVQLTEAEGNGGRIVGTAEWIAEGLKLEELQLTIRRDVKQQGEKITKPQQLKLAQRRKALETRIRRFHRQANAISHRADWGVDESEADDEEWEDEGPVVAREPHGPWSMFTSRPKLPHSENMAEQTPLGLPSNLSPVVFDDESLKRLAEQELTLRRGQANDALHQLRLLLGHKSFQFRTSIRHGKSNTKRTRAFTTMNKLDRAVSIHASIYRRCRAAMVVLGLSEEEQLKYQRLSKEDLNVTTAIAEPNKPGQRHKSTSWIWNIDVGGDLDRNDTLSIIHRIHWFHARSKVDRLEEEAGILRRELDSVGRYFSHHAEMWRDRAIQHPGDDYAGFAPYCRKRAAMYDRLYRDAQQTYRDVYADPNIFT